MAGANRQTPTKGTAVKDAEVADAAAVEGSDTTTDYTRRAGGWVLTDRGWVIEDQAADEHQDDEDAKGGDQT
jgi:cytochrome oxidase assembly protein ShyY1